MQNLQILTNNHLGKSFWEQRTGLLDSILINKLNVTSFNRIIKSQSTFMLLDFYFSKIPMQKKIDMISQVMLSVRQVTGPLKIFILSPTFTDTVLNYNEFDNKVVVSDNFTNNFLRVLQNESKNQYLNKSLLTSK
jgi:hypothetical protein